MISTLTPITLHPSAPPESHDLALQINQRLQELELHLASLKGSDGQQAALTSNLDLAGHKIVNVKGNLKTLSDAITTRRLKDVAVTKVGNVIQGNLIFQNPPSGTNGVTLSQINALLALYAKLVGSLDIEINDSSKGLILKSPNGTRWRLTIDDDGTVTRTPL